MRDCERRLKRLERCVAVRAAAANPHAMRIHFVAPGKGVTSTLLLDGDKRIWTKTPPGSTGDDALKLAQTGGERE